MTRGHPRYHVRENPRNITENASLGVEQDQATSVTLMSAKQSGCIERLMLSRAHCKGENEAALYWMR
jgi:hypothetical protein